MNDERWMVAPPHEHRHCDRKRDDVSEEALLETGDASSEIIAKTDKERHQRKAEGARNYAEYAFVPVGRHSPSTRKLRRYSPLPTMLSPWGLAPQLSSPPTPIWTASTLTVISFSTERSHWCLALSSADCE